MMKIIKYFRFYGMFVLLGLLLRVAHVRCECDTEADQKLAKFKSKDFCANIQCEKVKDCPDGDLVPNESYGKCCHVCVKHSDVGEPCDENMEGNLRKIGAIRCKGGLNCNNGKCVLEETNPYSCFNQRKIREIKSKEEYYADKLWIPKCDNQGEYEAKQNKLRKSVCVDEDGTEIFGIADKGNPKDACECSRQMRKRRKDITYNIKPQEHCSTSGSFDTIQCIGDLCYCADEKTGKVKGRLVKRQDLDKLPCYESDKSEKGYLKNCEVELQRYRHLAYEFNLKGAKIYGAERIKCDPDGSFAQTQCIPDRCVCTDPKGEGIGSYAITENMEKVNAYEACSCARDASSQDLFKCNGEGNYVNAQCLHGDCFCVDNNGDIISTQIEMMNATIFCQDLLKGLFTLPQDDITTETVTTDDDDDYYK